MGYGLIHIKKKEILMVNFGIIQLKKIETHPDKLKRILDRLNGLILEFSLMRWLLRHLFWEKMFNLCSNLEELKG